jgi:hypothetical protein
VQTAVRSMTFPEAVRFRAERGLSDAVVRAARMNRVSTSEYVRRTVRAQLIADGVALPALDDGDGPRTPPPASALRRAA